MPTAAKLNQIGVAWNWQYDADFIRLLDQSLHQAGLDSYLIGLHNLAQTMGEVERCLLYTSDAADE